MSSTYNAGYDPLIEIPASPADPAQKAFLITPSDTPNTMPQYPRSLRVYVASGTATIRVTPIHAVNDTDTVDLTFPAGLYVEPTAVRQVWNTALTGAPVIHGYW